MVDETMLPEPGSSMDDAMSDRDRRRHFCVGKKCSNPDDGVLLAADEGHLAKQGVSTRVLCVERARSLTDRFGRAGEQHFDT